MVGKEKTMKKKTSQAEIEAILEKVEEDCRKKEVAALKKLAEPTKKK